MTNEVCECNIDYGPCESHATVLVQREGASSRSADELALVFIEDAIDLGFNPDESMRTFLDGLVWDGSWLADTDESQTLWECRDEAESAVYALDIPDGHPTDGAWFIHTEDGYWISVIHSGPLLVTINRVFE